MNTLNPSSFVVFVCLSLSLVCMLLSLRVLCVILGSFRFSFRLVMHPYNTQHQRRTYISFGKQIRSSPPEQWGHLLFVHTLVIRCGTLTLPQSMLFPFIYNQVPANPSCQAKSCVFVLWLNQSGSYEELFAVTTWSRCDDQREKQLFDWKWQLRNKLVQMLFHLLYHKWRVYLIKKQNNNASQWMFFHISWLGENLIYQLALLVVAPSY